MKSNDVDIKSLELRRATMIFDHLHTLSMAEALKTNPHDSA